MSRTEAPTQPGCVDQRVLLRQLQLVRAVAKCLGVAAEHGNDRTLDFADAVAGLLIVLESAAVMLDPPGGAP